MPRWKGVASCVRNGPLHRMQIRIPDPGPGNAAGDFEELTDGDPQQAGRSHIVAAALIQAPETQNCQNEKDSFASQPGAGECQYVEKRSPYRLQCEQKIHAEATLPHPRREPAASGKFFTCTIAKQMRKCNRSSLRSVRKKFQYGKNFE